MEREIVEPEMKFYTATEYEIMTLCEEHYEREYVEEGWPEPKSKGYPNQYLDATYFMLVCEDALVGYTSFKHMGTYILVGNTYVQKNWRGKQIHSDLLTHRNKYLIDTFGLPILTVLNPRDGVSVEQLRETVSSLGYERCRLYSHVGHAMTKEDWQDLGGFDGSNEIWRLNA
jgi:hypothetical protein